MSRRPGIELREPGGYCAHCMLVVRQVWNKSKPNAYVESETVLRLKRFVYGRVYRWEILRNLTKNRITRVCCGANRCSRRRPLKLGVRARGRPLRAARLCNTTVSRARRRDRQGAGKGHARRTGFSHGAWRKIGPGIHPARLGDRSETSRGPRTRYKQPTIYGHGNMKTVVNGGLRKRGCSGGYVATDTCAPGVFCFRPCDSINDWRL